MEISVIMASSKGHVDDLDKETIFAGRVSTYSVSSNAAIRGNIWNRLGRAESSDGRRNLNQDRQASEKCGKCEMTHEFKCPAIGAICHNCNKPDHFARMCHKLIRLKS